MRQFGENLNIKKWKYLTKETLKSALNNVRTIENILSKRVSPLHAHIVNQIVHNFSSSSVFLSMFTGCY